MRHFELGPMEFYRFPVLPLVVMETGQVVAFIVAGDLCEEVATTIARGLGGEPPQVLSGRKPPCTPRIT